MAYEIYGENLFKYPYSESSVTKSGVTFVDNGDGTLTANGTATATVYFRVCNYGKQSGELTLDPGAYIVSGGSENLGVQVGYSYDDWASTSWATTSYATPKTFTLTAPARVRANLTAAKGKTLADETASPCLMKMASLTAPYQLVIVKNRVVAYGSDCFLAMGGSVICTQTGKRYDNATIAITETPPPCDLARRGYEFIQDVFIPCEPYGVADEGKVMVACEDCGTPKYSSLSIEDLIAINNRFATIAVTYPVDSSCTCSDGITTLVSDAAKTGQYTFDVPRAGTWTITISDGTDTVSANVDISERWQNKSVTMSYFTAYIYVAYPTGATCTVTDGSTTLTAPDTSGTHTFTVSTAGTWTVKSVGDKTYSATVSVTSGKTANVGLGPPEYTFNGGSGTAQLIDDGNNRFRLKLKKSGTLTFTKLNSFMNGVDVFCVGGGGGGGKYGGGGGGGYTKTATGKSVTKGTGYSIVIGAGGEINTATTAKGGDGGQTSAFSVKAAGGYGGNGAEQSSNASKGGNGGSGGCGRGSGSPGTDGGDDTCTTTARKGYGQKSTPGPNSETGSTREFGETSGTLYSSGGQGWETSSTVGTATNTNASDNTGDGGGAANANGKGGSGIVVIRNSK